MSEKTKALIEKIKAFVRRVPRRIWTAAAVAGGLTVVALIVLVVVKSQYSVLFTGLSSEEASSIMSYLDEQGVNDYRLDNGNTIMVPKGQENYLKMRLLMQGYPKSGFLYSTYFNNIGTFSTEAESNRAYLLDLQDRLGATISLIEGVENAVVSITPGQTSAYVLERGGVTSTKASVTVSMHNGMVLSDKAVEAIRQAVSHAVSGLEINSVAIMDTLGNSYSADSLGTNVSSASELKMLLEEKYGNLIRTNVLQVLAPLFGLDNIRVSVNTTVDVNRVTTQDTDVHLPEWAEDDGRGILGSEIWDHTIIRDPDDVEGGIVGTTENSDLPIQVEQGTQLTGDESTVATSGQKDYDNSRTETHTERYAGYISDCMISVTVDSTKAKDANVTSLVTHIARAAGISNEYATDKISVYMAPFYKEGHTGDDPTGFVPEPWMLYAAAGGLLLFLIVLFVILLTAKKRKKKKAAKLAAKGVPIAVPADMSPAESRRIMDVRSEQNMALRQDIRQFTEENPEIAAQMLRALMRGGEGDE